MLVTDILVQSNVTATLWHILVSCIALFIWLYVIWSPVMEFRYLLRGIWVIQNGEKETQISPFRYQKPLQFLTIFGHMIVFTQPVHQKYSLRNIQSQNIFFFRKNHQAQNTKVKTIQKIMLFSVKFTWCTSFRVIKNILYIHLWPLNT